MRRTLSGWFVIVHAIAHAFIGTWAIGHGSIWVATALWAAASLAYLVAGLGLLRVPILRDRWKPAMTIAIFASLWMVIVYLPPWGIPGAAIDLVILLGVLTLEQGTIDSDIAVTDAVGASATRHPALERTGWALGAALLAYVAVVTVARPYMLQWGTTAVERAALLPGDEVQPANATYRIDHGITIHAPASAVWPWLAQLGQDRGGFYSYDWLERLVGDRIHNADRIHAEWQRRGVGDTILATQRTYLGGRLGALGWRVSMVEPGRAIGLENWGTFVLVPVDSTTTRLLVRTRGVMEPTFGSFLAAPVGAYLFEPVHFVMERGMLRGIRDRAERYASSN